MKARLTPTQIKLRACVHLILATCTYVVVHVVCAHFLRDIPPGFERDALALIPLLPVLWVLWSIGFYITHADELQRRVNIEALAISAGVTAALTISYSLLEESAGFPLMHAKWVFLTLGLVWGGSGFVLWRRYK